MKSICNKVICATVIAVLINLIVPQIVKPFATRKQISPPHGPGSTPLHFKDQLVHMLVHHAQVPLSSSLIVAIIVAVSVSMCLCICK